MEAGADAIVTPCPLCHLSLDAWQEAEEAYGKDFEMPIPPRSSSASPPASTRELKQAPS
jgi:hypothetical protein